MMLGYYMALQKKSGGGGVPTDGLIVEHLFNGNVNDTSGNNRNASISGTGLTYTTDRHGNANSAIKKNGSDGVITTAITQSILNSTNQWTLSFWSNHSGGYASYDVVSLGLSGVNYFSFTFENSILYYFQYYTNRITVYNLFNGAWRHILLTKQSNNDVVLYVDGVQSGTCNFPFSPDYNDTFFIKLFTQYSTNALDDFRIYNRVLTSEEITALYEE